MRHSKLGAAEPNRCKCGFGEINSRKIKTSPLFRRSTSRTTSDSQPPRKASSSGVSFDCRGVFFTRTPCWPSTPSVRHSPPHSPRSKCRAAARPPVSPASWLAEIRLPGLNRAEARSASQRQSAVPSPSGRTATYTAGCGQHVSSEAISKRPSASAMNVVGIHLVVQSNSSRTGVTSHSRPCGSRHKTWLTQRL